jgi:hypothetical protein
MLHNRIETSDTSRIFRTLIRANIIVQPPSVVIHRFGIRNNGSSQRGLRRKNEARVHLRLAFQFCQVRIQLVLWNSCAAVEFVMPPVAHSYRESKEIVDTLALSAEGAIC